MQARRFGGDLQGVIDQLDYLEDLGITAIGDVVFRPAPLDAVTARFDEVVAAALENLTPPE